MSSFVTRRKTSLLFRSLCAFIALSFLTGVILPPGEVSAQFIPQALGLPVPGAMVRPTAGYTPALIQGMTVHPENPLEFDFIIDRGDSGLDHEALEDEAQKLIKYFLASLTVPENELWVNLSPYEKDRIIPDGFGVTEMGRDMLAQDYLLKQLTASLMYPEGELGKKFWERVFKKARDMYGTTDIPLNTFNKVWIMPDKASVYEHGTSVFIVESHLKVMLEEDYAALQQSRGRGEFGLKDLEQKDAQAVSGTTSEIVREVLIPELEREINEGKTFANLRQIFNSLILAKWYKENLRATLLGQIYVDKNKTSGVDVADKDVKQKIYAQYLEALKKGVFDYIKDDYDPAAGEYIPRKYFSGGVRAGDFSMADGIKTFREGEPLPRGSEKRMPDGRDEVVVKARLAETEQETQALRASSMEIDIARERLRIYGIPESDLPFYLPKAVAFISHGYDFTVLKGVTSDEIDRFQKDQKDFVAHGQMVLIRRDAHPRPRPAQGRGMFPWLVAGLLSALTCTGPGCGTAPEKGIAPVAQKPAASAPEEIKTVAKEDTQQAASRKDGLSRAIKKLFPADEEQAHVSQKQPRQPVVPPKPEPPLSVDPGIARLISQFSLKDTAKQREAIRKLAEIGKPAVPALIEALESSSTVVRGAAAITLGRIGPDAKEATMALARVRDTTSNAALQKIINSALNNIILGPPEKAVKQPVVVDIEEPAPKEIPLGEPGPELARSKGDKAEPESHAGVRELTKEELSQLVLAIQTKNLAKVKSLLAQGGSVDSLQSPGDFTLLQHAAGFGSREIIEFLLQRGADVNAKGAMGLTALHMAAPTGRDDIIRLLLEHKANVNATNIDGVTPLFLAAEAGQASVVASLLELGAEVNVQTKTGLTSLMTASQYGHEAVVRNLIDSKANTNLMSSERYTALYLALVNKHPRIVDMLVAAGADVNFEARKDRIALLWVAVASENVQSVNSLLIAGANPDVRGRENDTPLVMAIMGEKEDIVEALVAYGADVNMEVGVKSGKRSRCIHLAAAMGNEKIMHILLENGVDIYAKNFGGLTAIDIARQENNLKMVSLLEKAQRGEIEIKPRTSKVKTEIEATVRPKSSPDSEPRPPSQTVKETTQSSSEPSAEQQAAEMVRQQKINEQISILKEVAADKNTLSFTRYDKLVAATKALGSLLAKEDARRDEVIAAIKQAQPFGPLPGDSFREAFNKVCRLYPIVNLPYDLNQEVFKSIQDLIESDDFQTDKGRDPNDAVNALVQTGKTVVPFMIKVLDDQQGRYSKERLNACRVLEKLGTEAVEAVPALINSSAWDFDGVDVTVKALAAIGEGAVPYLLRALDNYDYNIIQNSLKVLGEIGPAAASVLPKLKELQAQTGPIGLYSFAKEEINAALAGIQGGKKTVDIEIQVPAGFEALSPSQQKKIFSLFSQIKSQDASEFKLNLKDVLADSRAADMLAQMLGMYIQTVKQSDLRISAMMMLERMGEKASPALSSIIQVLNEARISVKKNRVPVILEYGANAGDLSGSRALIIIDTEDNEELIAASAADVIGAMGTSGARAVPDLIISMERGNIKAARALSQVDSGSYGVLAALKKALKSEDAFVRKSAAEALAKIGNKVGTIPAELIESLRDPSPFVYAAAAKAVYAIGVNEGAVQYDLMAILRKNPRYSESDVNRLFPGVRNENLIEGLQAELKSKVEEAQLFAAAGIAKMESRAESAVPSLIDLLKSDNMQLRASSAFALGHIKKSAEAVVPALKRALADSKDLNTKLFIIQALGDYGKAAESAVKAIYAVGITIECQRAVLSNPDIAEIIMQAVLKIEGAERGAQGLLRDPNVEVRIKLNLETSINYSEEAEEDRTQVAFFDSINPSRFIGAVAQQGLSVRDGQQVSLAGFELDGFWEWAKENPWAAILGAAGVSGLSLAYHYYRRSKQKLARAAREGETSGRLKFMTADPESADVVDALRAQVRGRLIAQGVPERIVGHFVQKAVEWAVRGDSFEVLFDAERPEDRSPQLLALEFFMDNEIVDYGNIVMRRVPRERAPRLASKDSFMTVPNTITGMMQELGEDSLEAEGQPWEEPLPSVENEFKQLFAVIEEIVKRSLTVKPETARALLQALEGDFARNPGLALKSMRELLYVIQRKPWARHLGDYTLVRPVGDSVQEFLDRRQARISGAWRFPETDAGGRRAETGEQPGGGEGRAEGDLGGIDFDPSRFNLQIRRDGQGIPLPVEQQPIPLININGLTPVIIHMAPIVNVPLLLGLGTAPDAEQEGQQEWSRHDLMPVDRKEKFSHS